MERESSVLKHRTVVQPFLIDAFKEGAHNGTKPKNTSQDQWLRQRMISVVYNDIGSSATVEELAHKHGTFKQSVADSNKRFLRNLWNNSSPTLQERYPLNELLTARKPWSQRSRESASRRMGGASLKIKEQVESGVPDIDTISENTGIPPRTVSNFRGRLREWGVDVPKKYASHREVLEQIDKETDDQKIQELLDGLPYFVVRYDIVKKKEASKFSWLYNFIKEAGFRSYHRNTHFFATSLESVGVPISLKERVVNGVNPRTLIYYVVLSRHRERAIQTLREDQSLQRFQRNSS